MLIFGRTFVSSSGVYNILLCIVIFMAREISFDLNLSSPHVLLISSSTHASSNSVYVNPSNSLSCCIFESILTFLLHTFSFFLAVVTFFLTRSISLLSQPRFLVCNHWWVRVICSGYLSYFLACIFGYYATFVIFFRTCQ